MSTPEVARAVFGERLPLAEAYVAWLTGAGIERGLLGPREAERIWERHVLNCAAIAALVADGVTVADVGSGAGLPGIPLALARPSLAVTLIEPLLRRAAFLEEVCADLPALEVQVLRARAEDVTARYDVVVSRAVAPLDRLARWCTPLLRPGGTMLAIKGSSAAEEVAEHRQTLGNLGLTELVVRTLDDGTGGSTTVVQARRTGTPTRQQRSTKTASRKAVAQ